MGCIMENHNQPQELATGEEIARCPSCSLYITVIYNPDDFAECLDDGGGGGGGTAEAQGPPSKAAEVAPVC